MSNKGTKTPSGDESPIDLSSVLARPVAAAYSAPVFDAEAIIIEPELDPEPEPQPTVYAENNGGGDQQQSYDGEPQSLSPDDLAIIGVNLFDGLQSTLFALIRRNRVFDEAERELIGKLDPTGRTAYTDGTREAIAMAKFKRHQEAVKNLPFSEGEKKRLTDATMIYARTTNVKVSPFTGLLLAYSEVLGTRAFTVLGDTD